MKRPAPRDDGVIPLPVPPDPESEGCGVRGCLIGASVVFVILLGVLVFGLLTRVWITPAPGVQ